MTPQSQSNQGDGEHEKTPVGANSSVRAMQADYTTEPRELLCQLCSADYPVWYAPNSLWNAVMRHPDGREASEKYQFVCINCFSKEAAKLGVELPVWTTRTEVEQERHRYGVQARRDEIGNLKTFIEQSTIKQPERIKLFRYMGQRKAELNTLDEGSDT